MPSSKVSLPRTPPPLATMSERSTGISPRPTAETSVASPSAEYLRLLASFLIWLSGDCVVIYFPSNWPIVWSQKLLCILSENNTSVAGFSIIPPRCVRSPMRLHRQNRVLLLLARCALVCWLAQRLAQLHAGVLRGDDRVHVASLCGYIGAGHVRVVEVHEHLLRHHPLLRGHRGQFLALHHDDGGLRTHHRDLRGRPREVHVRREVLGPHDGVTTAKGLAHHHGELRHRRIGQGEAQ